MKKEINLQGKQIAYNLEYKNVKNINLRIKPDGSISVSANKSVTEKRIEAFLIQKSDFILKTLENYQDMKKTENYQYFSESRVVEVITALCEKAYPYYEKRGVKYPKIKFRKMVSQWGNCYPKRGILTFNTNLMYAPIECIEYVVWHEFTHFLQANHSKSFYDELAAVCPMWQRYRRILRGIRLK